MYLDPANGKQALCIKDTNPNKQSHSVIYYFDQENPLLGQTKRIKFLKED